MKKKEKPKSCYIREVFFKEKSSIASRRKVVAKLDSINSHKVLSISEGYKSMMVNFDDGLDMLAFMVASGLVKMTVKSNEESKHRTGELK